MLANFASAGFSRQNPGKILIEALKRPKTKIWLQILILHFYWIPLAFLSSSPGKKTILPPFNSIDYE